MLPNTGTLRLLAIGLVLLGTTSASARGKAQSASVAKSSEIAAVEKSWGTYTTSIPIKLPAYHSMTPTLSLAYSSDAGNGPVGLGWSLTGVGTITREGPSRGVVPRYDSSDLYRATGAASGELYPCQTDSASPSCTSGGNYSTRIESHVRVHYDSGSNSWTVTRRDGSISRYGQTAASRVATAQGTYRWHLDQQQDTFGNTVTYEYWADPAGGGELYLDRVRYGAAQVTLYREARPANDVPSYGRGGSSLGRINYRIKTVDICVKTPATVGPCDTSGTVDPVRARSYKLQYAQSSHTQRSLLTSVTQYGTDALVDAAGTVSGGSALPPTALTYHADSGAFAEPENWNTKAVLGDGKAAYPRKGVPQGYEYVKLIDFDGDGRLDYVSYYKWTSPGGDGLWVLRNNGAGFDPPVKWDAKSLLGDSKYKYPSYYHKADLVDINGDGRKDYVANYNNNASGEKYGLWVLINNGTSFDAPANWNTKVLLGSTDYARPVHTTGTDITSVKARLIDMNGDGRPEYVANYNDNASGEKYGLWVLNNNGAGFDAPINWNTKVLLGSTDYANPVHSYGESALTDMNGDGRPDYVADYNNNASGEKYGLWVLINNGTGFDAPANWNSKTLLNKNECSRPLWGAAYVGGGGDNARLIDMNGDSLPDYVSYYNWASPSGHGLWVLLNNGSGFEPPQNWDSKTLLGDGDGAKPRSQGYWGMDETEMMDINGDGRPDLLSFKKWSSPGGNGMWVLLNSGSGFEPPQNLNTAALIGNGDMAHPVYHHGDCCYEQDDSRTEDIDGDGLTDYASYNKWTSPSGNGLWVVKQQGTVPDLLRTLTKPLGGMQTVQYKPSTAYPNQYLPNIRQVVSQVQTDDGRGNVSTVSYSYEGGLWSDAERRFLGFRKVTATIDALGTTRETWFTQDFRTPSRADEVFVKDSSGAIYAYTDYVYSEPSASPPYVSELTDRWDYECERTPSCRRVLTQFDYDAYGNPTVVKKHGDYDITGDELTTENLFFANTSAYIVSRSGISNTYEGLGTGGTLKRRLQRLYDGAASYTVPPTAGKETTTRAWASHAGGLYYETTRTYDSAGNVTSETKPTGTTAAPLTATTTTTYDANKLYPLQRCNALNHCVSISWNEVLGVKLTETDANGKITTQSYDAFGRPIQETLPNGGVTNTSYVNIGSPAGQYVTTSVVDGTPDGLWSVKWLDGLGRTYLKTREGSVPGSQMAQWIAYAADVPTHVWRRSAWYDQPGEPGSVYDQMTYDGMGRVVRTDHADGSTDAASYAVGSVTTTDELGKQRTSEKDGHGRLWKVHEHNGGATYTTTYAYDALSNLTSVTDHHGNVTSAVYDSLGRKVRDCDPDRGCWDMAHNRAGSVLATYDSKGQVVVLTYDLLERPLTKTGGYTWVYDEAGHGDSKGRVTTRSFPDGADSLDYDHAGRIVARRMCRDASCKAAIANTCNAPHCYAVSQTFDTVGAGRLATVVYPDETVTYGYDASGRLTSASGYLVGATYDARGQLTGAALQNGVNEVCSYDSTTHRLQTSEVTKGSTLYSAAYQYELNGWIKQLAISNAPCGPDCAGKDCGDDGCGGSCGGCTAPLTCSSEGQCFVCTPDCTGKDCGDDGCGGACGGCTPPLSCSGEGQCVCTPDCAGKGCGDDGCGGSCGSCTAPLTCSGAGQCVCTPDCAGKSCGDDGCGGSCGGCTAPLACDGDGQCVAVGPTVVGSTKADSGGTTSLSISVPSGLADGDVLYAFISKHDNGGTLSGPAGWVQLRVRETTSGTDFTTGAWRRVVTSAASEPGSYAFTHTDGSEEMSGSIVAVRGASTTTPEDVAVVEHDFSANDPTPDSPSVTTVTDKALVLVYQGLTSAYLTSIGAPSNTTLVQSNLGSNRNSGVAFFIKDLAGATGAVNWPNAYSSTSPESHTMTVAVRPLPCAPDCAGKDCGDDGCGGSCGSCAIPFTCGGGGQCFCTPDCTGKDCGDDGCGGSCGGCTAPLTCDGAGKCVTCTPACTGKDCGDDGCGGSCGGCTNPLTCDGAGQCVGSAPTVVGSAKADAVTKTLSISVPSGLADSDVLYAFITKHDNSGTLSGPSGWVQLGVWETTSGNDFTTGIWRRVVTSAGSEPGSYAFTHTDGDQEEMSGYIVAVRGASSTAPEDVPAAHRAGTNDPTPDSPSVATVTDKTLVLVHQGVTHDITSIGTPSNTTLVQSNLGYRRNSGVAFFVKDLAGATDAMNWPNGSSGSGAEWHTLTVAIRPE